MLSPGVIPGDCNLILGPCLGQNLIAQLLDGHNAEHDQHLQPRSLGLDSIYAKTLHKRGLYDVCIHMYTCIYIYTYKYNDCIHIYIHIHIMGIVRMSCQIECRNVCETKCKNLGNCGVRSKKVIVSH